MEVVSTQAGVDSQQVRLRKVRLQSEMIHPDCMAIPSSHATGCLDSPGPSSGFFEEYIWASKAR